jgi:hypothetical protein
MRRPPPRTPRSRRLLAIRLRGNPAPQPREAPWEPVDVQVVNTPRGRYKIEQRFQPKPQPRERPKPLPVHVPDGGDVDVEPMGVGGSLTAGGRASWSWEAPRVTGRRSGSSAYTATSRSIRVSAAVSIVCILLASWLGYVAGHGAGRAEMAREIIRAGVHRLADRPALVDTIEDASGWDADTREEERQRGRDEGGR